MFLPSDLQNVTSRGKRNLNSDQQTNPQHLAQSQKYLHKWFTTEEILLRASGARLGGLRGVVASLCADYHPFFRQGAGERYCGADQQHTLGNLLFPSAAPPPPAALLNQAGPGLRRTELCLLIRLLGRRAAHTGVRRYFSETQHG